LRRIPVLLLLAASACSGVDEGAGLTPPNRESAQTACADKIRQDLTTPETAEITFREGADGLVARVITTNPDDGLTAQLDFLCAYDAAGRVTARLLAG